MEKQDQIKKIIEKTAFYRKPARFVDVPDKCSVEITKEELSVFSIFEIEEVTQGPYGLVNDYLYEMHQFHVLKNNDGDLYLVNTEGFDYPRYVSKIILK